MEETIDGVLDESDFGVLKLVGEEENPLVIGKSGSERFFVGIESIDAPLDVVSLSKAIDVAKSLVLDLLKESDRERLFASRALAAGLIANGDKLLPQSNKFLVGARDLLLKVLDIASDTDSTIGIGS